MTLKHAVAVIFAVAVPMGSAAAAGAPVPGNGNYTMTIRQCTGPLATEYAVGTTLPTTISSSGVIVIDGMPNVVGQLHEGRIEVREAAVTGSRGRWTGVPLTESVIIQVENDLAVGGIVHYSLTDDGGSLRSGSYHFSLSRKHNGN